MPKSSSLKNETISDFIIVEVEVLPIWESACHAKSFSSSVYRAPAVSSHASEMSQFTSP